MLRQTYIIIHNYSGNCYETTKHLKTKTIKTKKSTPCSWSCEDVTLIKYQKTKLFDE